MQRSAWNWDRWWIFTFFKLLPLTTVDLSPSHHGRKLSSPRLLLLFDKCTGIGYFFGREQVSVSNNWNTMLLFKWRSGNFTHTQFTQSQETSHPSYPIPRRFTLNSRTPTPRLEILWILLETLSPVSTPSPMMLIDKWSFKNLKHNRCHNNKSVFLFQFVDTELLVWPKQ